MLRWTGHPDVRVLDGGLPAWEGPLEKSVPAPAEGDFVPEPGAAGLLDADAAAELARPGCSWTRGRGSGTGARWSRSIR
ncbi:hypothetical protein GCM10011428_54720 [Streptomyces violaceus]